MSKFTEQKEREKEGGSVRKQRITNAREEVRRKRKQIMEGMKQNELIFSSFSICFARSAYLSVLSVWSKFTEKKTEKREKRRTRKGRSEGAESEREKTVAKERKIFECTQRLIKIH